jgi:alpha/beta superfamily hydrolase
VSVWKEQAVTVEVPEAGIVLEAVWQAGSRRGAVIAPPHPLYGGSLENPVVNELAFGLHKRDVPSLRFNWRGVGASQGAPTDDFEAAEADYLAAVDHMVATVDGPILGCGYSFGAATAIRAALRESHIQSLVLVAPPAPMLESLPLEELEIPLQVIVGGDDPFAPSAELSARLSSLPNAKLEVLPGVDHFFMAGGLADIARFATAAASGAA